jgi:lactoylglutathione lyase
VSRQGARPLRLAYGSVPRPGSRVNEGGGPTDDKPTVTLTTPPDPDRTSAFLNVRVADIDRVYREWSARGAEFPTAPKDHGRELRASIRDPDGHLIEVGQTTGMLS